RNDDNKELLIGYSQLKYHSFDKKQFKGYGRYGKKDNNERIWPYDGETDEEIIKRVTDDFILERGAESVLSIIIPAIDEYIVFEIIIESVLKEFYLPLMNGVLEVEVTDLISEEFITTKNVSSISEKYLKDEKD